MMRRVENREFVCKDEFRDVTGDVIVGNHFIDKRIVTMLTDVKNRFEKTIAGAQ